jgi:hypothetical protein
LISARRDGEQVFPQARSAGFDGSAKKMKKVIVVITSMIKAAASRRLMR